MGNPQTRFRYFHFSDLEKEHKIFFDQNTILVRILVINKGVSCRRGLGVSFGEKFIYPIFRFDKKFGSRLINF